MGLYHSWVFVQAVMELLQCSVGVVGEVLCLGKEYLGFSKALVLFCHIFEQFGSLGEVLWSRGTLADWLVSAVDEILLGKLEQKVSAELDVKIDVAC